MCVCCDCFEVFFPKITKSTLCLGLKKIGCRYLLEMILGHSFLLLLHKVTFFWHQNFTTYTRILLFPCSCRGTTLQVFCRQFLFSTYMRIHFFSGNFFSFEFCLFYFISFLSLSFLCRFGLKICLFIMVIIYLSNYLSFHLEIIVPFFSPDDLRLFCGRFRFLVTNFSTFRFSATNSGFSFSHFGLHKFAGQGYVLVSHHPPPLYPPKSSLMLGPPTPHPFQSSSKLFKEGQNSRE